MRNKSRACRHHTLSVRVHVVAAATPGLCHPWRDTLLTREMCVAVQGRAVA